MTTMDRVGREHGCGRAFAEADRPAFSRFGTLAAFLLLPYWTDSCIATINEGLEVSETSLYEQLVKVELTKTPNINLYDLPYQNLVVGQGVEHLQLMGVRYYLAVSPETKAQADTNPDLVRRARSGPWNVYEVRGAPLVAPLAFQPAVIEGKYASGALWSQVGVNYFEKDRRGRDVALAAGGPDSWARVPVRELEPTANVFNLPAIGTGVNVDAPRVQVAPARVSRIRTSDDRISFDVDRTGSPVLVKTSYFPNWQAHGAKGPRATSASTTGGRRSTCSASRSRSPASPASCCSPGGAGIEPARWCRSRRPPRRSRRRPNAPARRARRRRSRNARSGRGRAERAADVSSGAVRSAGAEERVPRRRACRDHLVERGLVAASRAQRAECGRAVVAVHLVAVIRVPVHPDGGDQHELVDLTTRDDALGHRVDHPARDTGLRGSPREAGVPVAAHLGLVDEERDRLGRKAGPHHGDEGCVTVGRCRQRGGERRADRAGPGAEHGVHVGGVGSRPHEALADLHDRDCAQPSRP